MPGPFQDPKNTHAVEVKNAPDGTFYAEFFRRCPDGQWHPLLTGLSCVRRENVYKMVKALADASKPGPAFISGMLAVYVKDGVFITPPEATKLLCNIFRQEAPVDKYVFNITDREGLPFFTSARTYVVGIDAEEDMIALRIALAEHKVGGLDIAKGENHAGV